MKVNELTNLWVGYNKVENFRVLICALDIYEASEIADNYRIDSCMRGNFEIRVFVDVDTEFDCDYILTNEH